MGWLSFVSVLLVSVIPLNNINFRSLDPVSQNFGLCGIEGGSQQLKLLDEVGGGGGWLSF